MITTPQGFDLQGQEPLEGKTVQTDLTARDNITLVTRYEGLEVYVVSEEKSYRLQGGTTNSDWVEMINDLSPFINVSTGAPDAGKPIILNASGKIDGSMIESGSLSLYYLLDGSSALTGNMNADGYRLTGLGDGVGAQDAATVNQLSGYLPLAGTAANSSQLNGQPASYYLNASNINAGTIDDAYLPSTISSDITGNAATATVATALQTARTITISGDATSPAVAFDGSANITIPVTISAGVITLANHTAGNGIVGSTYDGTIAREWSIFYAGSGGNYGTSNAVARYDHSHFDYEIGTVSTSAPPASGRINASYTHSVEFTSILYRVVELQVAIGNSTTNWSVSYNDLLGLIDDTDHRPNATILTMANVSNSASAVDHNIAIQITSDGQIRARNVGPVTVYANSYLQFHTTYITN